MKDSTGGGQVESDTELGYIIERSAKESAGAILASVGNSDSGKDFYAVKLRVKSAEDIQEKVSRKLEVNPDYDLMSITDIIGLRIVTLFRSEIPVAVSGLLKLINGSNGPFCPDNVEEAIIYSANPTFDNVAPKIERVLIENGVNENLIQRKSSDTGYSSIHLIARSRSREPFPTKSKLSDYQVPVEIQVRTVFEDAWGEIDHLYNYAAKRTNRRDSKRGLSRKLTDVEARSIGNHLLTLKNFTDACALYADAIQQDVEQIKPLPLTQIVQIDEDSETEKRLREAGVDSDLIEEFVTANKEYRTNRKVVGGLNSKLEKDPEIEAAESYLVLTRKAISFYEESSNQRSELIYYTKMNEALARLRSRAANEIQVAGKIYADLHQAFPQRPSPAYRLAMVHRELEMFDESVSSFEDSCNAYSRILELEETERREHVLHSEELMLRYLLPKGFGFAWYKKSELAESTEQRCSDLHKAYKCTLIFGDVDPIETDIEAVTEIKIDCVNNLLYYLGEILKSCPELVEDAERKDLEERRFHYRAILIENTDLNISDDILALDTLAKEFVESGQLEIAKKYAARIVDLTLPDGPNAVVRRLNLEETEIAAQAVQILRR